MIGLLNLLSLRGFCVGLNQKGKKDIDIPVTRKRIQGDRILFFSAVAHANFLQKLLRSIIAAKEFYPGCS